MTAMSKQLEDLDVWTLAMELAERIYDATKRFPDDERFGMTSQLRRAVVSIPSNIAEGRGRGGDPEFLRFLDIAYGSLMEVETQLELSRRFGYLTDQLATELRDTTSQLARMLNGLRNKVRKRIKRP